MCLNTKKVLRQKSWVVKKVRLLGMELEGLGDLLGVKKPWIFRSTEVHHKTNVLDIYIDFERGT